MHDVLATGGGDMTTSAEAVARDREQTFVLGTEARFPLDLTGSVPAQWAAYEAAIEDAWDPENSTLWDGFDPELIAASDRAAGALVWSHRTWVEYPAIAESEAVLVRACLEPGTSIDFKYCLSLRAVERARSTDLAHILAARLGAYQSAPAGPELIALLDDDLVRRALHVTVDLDAYVAAHLIAQSAIDLAMWQASIENATPTLAKLLAFVVRDKARMIAVGWTQMMERIPQRDDGGRRLIARTVSDVLQTEELKGRQVPVFLGPGEDRDRLLAAHELAAAAGLGGVVGDDQRRVAHQAITDVADRFHQLGVEIDMPR